MYLLKILYELLSNECCYQLFIIFDTYRFRDSSFVVLLRKDSIARDVSRMSLWYCLIILLVQNPPFPFLADLFGDQMRRATQQDTPERTRYNKSRYSSRHGRRCLNSFATFFHIVLLMLLSAERKRRRSRRRRKRKRRRRRNSDGLYHVVWGATFKGMICGNDTPNAMFGECRRCWRRWCVVRNEKVDIRIRVWCMKCRCSLSCHDCFASFRFVSCRLRLLINK